MAEAFLDYWRDQGVIMWALHVVAVLTLAAVLDRLLFWTFARAARSSITTVRGVKPGGAAAALERLSARRGRPDYLVAVARAGQTDGGAPAHAIAVAHGRLAEMDHHVGLLDWSVATAPLLGILGTGIGMAIAFRQNASGLPDPGALGQGISLALQTTIWGLSISILAATARAILRGIRRRALRRIETLIELVNHAHRGKHSS